MSAQQHLITKTAGDKLKTMGGELIARWPELTKSWDPKRDFAFAMLHAERLTQLLTDEMVAEIFLEQSKVDPERREVLERWLERAEPRSRFLHDQITTTGQRLLSKLAPLAEPRSAIAAE